MTNGSETPEVVRIGFVAPPTGAAMSATPATTMSKTKLTPLNERPRMMPAFPLAIPPLEAHAIGLSREKYS